MLSLWWACDSTTYLRPSICPSRCRYHFCGGADEVLPIGTELGLSSATVCLEGSPTSLSHALGEARVGVGTDWIKISDYHPGGLTENFSRSWFRSFSFGVGNNITAVGHDQPRGNQLQWLDQKCLVLPVHSGPDGDGAAVESRECVSFFFDVPKMTITLRWDEPSDLDLHVGQPNGGHIWWGADISASGGRLLFDDTADSCQRTRGGHEVVYYGGDAIPEMGWYHFHVKEWDNCGSMSVNWELQVSTPTQTRTWRGVATSGNDSVVG
eukprot:CAMPEP_0184687116 /NCGR_PEP_ID=MMETSP0312-20130426/25170_1 /TAXON_ID=31354 /ORGANISM="Compsopogon coeruleus, Strain SAG 36.94" /LENGTH=266 /DNA_ID=CAMNT_0027142887 /DNA_START=506 /DNA_END=1303 /DNA_ORIENTATION=-